MEDCDEASANDNNGEVEYITYNGERIKVAKKLTCYRTDCNHTVIKGSHFDRDDSEIFPAEKAKIKVERLNITSQMTQGTRRHYSKVEVKAEAEVKVW